MESEFYAQKQALMLVSMFGIYRSRYCNISTKIDLSADLHSWHEFLCVRKRCERVSSEWFIVVFEVYDIPVRIWVLMSLVMPRYVEGICFGGGLFDIGLRRVACHTLPTQC